jgi:four helix bundle protein
MSKQYSYRNLILWQRAQEMAHEVIALTRRMSPTWANAVIARQIIASATSIGANIAEGHGRFTPGAHRNHLSIAKGSAAETDSWLDLLRREGVITAAEEQVLHDKCSELIAMLTAKIRDLERLGQGGDTNLREEREGYLLNDESSQPPAPFTPVDYQ